ncbi:unnamed protein product, partial [Ascophyllum nodosum]
NTQEGKNTGSSSLHLPSAVRCLNLKTVSVVNLKNEVANQSLVVCRTGKIENTTKIESLAAPPLPHAPRWEEEVCEKSELTHRASQPYHIQQYTRWLPIRYVQKIRVT